MYGDGPVTRAGACASGIGRGWSHLAPAAHFWGAVGRAVPAQGDYDLRVILVGRAKTSGPAVRTSPLGLGPATGCTDGETGLR